MGKLVFLILVFLIAKANMDNSTSLYECPDAEIPCICRESSNVAVKSFLTMHRLIRSKGIDCLQAYYETCRRHSCSYIPEIVTEVKHEALFPKKRFIYPLRVIYPPLDEADELQPKTRFRRFPHRCNDSIAPVKHAVLSCTYWPEFVTCEVNCTHGYALEEDGKVMLKTTRKCRESIHYWSPKPSFPVCKPYYNCRAVLQTPGSLVCKESEEMFSYCDISCLPYEDFNEIPEKRYPCIDENYEKVLPHCATTDKSVRLIPNPMKGKSGK